MSKITNEQEYIEGIAEEYKLLLLEIQQTNNLDKLEELQKIVDIFFWLSSFDLVLYKESIKPLKEFN